MEKRGCKEKNEQSPRAACGFSMPTLKSTQETNSFVSVYKDYVGIIEGYIGYNGKEIGNY